MKLRQAILVLCAAPLLGCGTPASQPQNVEEAKTLAPPPVDMGDIASFASHVESLVVAGDVAGLEGLWLLPEHLEGCTVEGKPVTKERMSSFAEENLQALRRSAEQELAENRRGTALHTNHWTGDEPSYLKGVLVGEACQAKKFARVNVIIKPDKGPPAVVEHRFNAQLVGDAWRLYRYMPTKPACDSPQGRKSIGCVKLAEG